MTGLAVYLAIVVAFAALCCGHQGEDFPIPLRDAWRYLRAPHRAFRASRATEPPPDPAEKHTEPRPCPSWAHADLDAA